MAKNLSIKNVPDELVERLRELAKGNRRSLQGELLTAIEEHSWGLNRGRRLTVQDIMEINRRRGVSSTESSVDIIREMRDSR